MFDCRFVFNDGCTHPIIGNLQYNNSLEQIWPCHLFLWTKEKWMLGIEIGPNEVENIHNLPQAILRVDRLNQNGEEEGKMNKTWQIFCSGKMKPGMNVIYGLDAKFGLKPSHLKWVWSNIPRFLVWRASFCQVLASCKFE